MKPNQEALRSAPLRLQKETLRTLLDHELDRVAGGTSIDNTGTEHGPNCWISGGSDDGSGSDTVFNY